MKLLIIFITVLIGGLIGFTNAHTFGIYGLLLTAPESIFIGFAGGTLAATHGE